MASLSYSNQLNIIKVGPQNGPNALIKCITGKVTTLLLNLILHGTAHETVGLLSCSSKSLQSGDKILTYCTYTHTV